MARRGRGDRSTFTRFLASVVAAAALLPVAAGLAGPVAVAGAGAGAAAAPAAVRAAADAPFARDSARAEVVALINGERRAAGLRPLTVDLVLSSRAHDSAFACPGGGSTPGRARDVAEHAGLTHELSGCPGHTIVDVMPAWGYRAFTGEILAYNYEASDLVTYRFGCPPGSRGFDCRSAGTTLAVSRTAATAVRQWIDSPSHHDIMLGAFDRFGCGAWAGTATTAYGTGGAFYACVFSKGGPAKNLDTRAPSVRAMSVAARAGLAGARPIGADAGLAAGGPIGAGTAAAGAASAASMNSTTTVAAGATVTVSSTIADVDTLGRVAGWQVALDGRVVVDTLGSGRIDAGRGAIRVEATLATAGLAAGSHAVTIRARDLAGRWSAPSTATLVLAP